MSDSKRLVIGSEINDDRKIELQERGNLIVLPVSLINSGGSQANLPSGLVSENFDTIVLNYTDSTKTVLSTVQYKLGAVVVATITYTSATTSDTYAKT